MPLGTKLHKPPMHLHAENQRNITPQSARFRAVGNSFTIDRFGPTSSKALGLLASDQTFWNSGHRRRNSQAQPRRGKVSEYRYDLLNRQSGSCGDGKFGFTAIGFESQRGET